MATETPTLAELYEQQLKAEEAGLEGETIDGMAHSFFEYDARRQERVEATRDIVNRSKERLHFDLPGMQLSSEDLYRAARILITGTLCDFLAAHALAQQAYQGGYQAGDDGMDAMRLAAEAWDLSRVMLGYAQDFGTLWQGPTRLNVAFRHNTQRFVEPRSERDALRPPVNADFPDNVRTAYGVPPLAEQQPPTE